jgi:hypothetical protein
MVPTTKLILVFLLTFTFIRLCFGDAIVTFDGDEFQGKIIEVTDDAVKYLPAGSSSGATRKLPKKTVFMLKYDDGRKEVFTVRRVNDGQRSNADHRVYSAYVFLETGLFGLVNINENDFDAGVVTFGVTPSIDRRINRFISIGVEYMILWAKPKKADDARFLMNCNACCRLSFPVHRKFNFLTQVNAGLSIWPGAQSIHATDTTFFKDRTGWDIHGGIGLEYKTRTMLSFVMYAGYNANFSTLHDIPITIDMLIVSICPRIKF